MFVLHLWFFPGSVSQSVTRPLIKLPATAKTSQALLIMATNLCILASATLFNGISFGSNEQKCENASLVWLHKVGWFLTTNHPRPPVAQTDLGHSSKYQNNALRLMQDTRHRQTDELEESKSGPRNQNS